jgi:hypothetical protein
MSAGPQAPQQPSRSAQPAKKEGKRHVESVLFEELDVHRLGLKGRSLSRETERDSFESVLSEMLDVQKLELQTSDKGRRLHHNAHCWCSLSQEADFFKWAYSLKWAFW